MSYQANAFSMCLTAWAMSMYLWWPETVEYVDAWMSTPKK